jgi:hypothetical protein
MKDPQITRPVSGKETELQDVEKQPERGGEEAVLLRVSHKDGRGRYGCEGRKMRVGNMSNCGL